MSPSNIASFAIESLGREDHRLADKSENSDGIDVCSHGIQKGILHQGWSTALIQLLKTRLSEGGDSTWRRQHHPGDHRELARTLTAPFLQYLPDSDHLLLFYRDSRLFQS